jgi:hypothetical protein
VYLVPQCNRIVERFSALLSPLHFSWVIEVVDRPSSLSVTITSIPQLKPMVLQTEPIGPRMSTGVEKIAPRSLDRSSTSVQIAASAAPIAVGIGVGAGSVITFQDKVLDGPDAPFVVAFS